MNDVKISDWSNTTTLTYNNTEIGEFDMGIMLHVNRGFSAEELSLQVTTLTPDSLRYTEQIILPIKQMPQSSIQAATDIEIPYRRNVHFRRKGEYIWHITPTQKVVGVEAVGMHIHVNN